MMLEALFVFRFMIFMPENDRWMSPEIQTPAASWRHSSGIAAPTRARSRWIGGQASMKPDATPKN